MGAAALAAVLGRYDRLAIAVSGGVDSMLLAHMAYECARARGASGTEIVVVHALSPAVPFEASARVEDHARAGGWRLKLVDAGEQDDPRYQNNPANRCYFCKTNLYARIASVCEGTIASGTNCDDMGDFRPGLHAAREHNVVHPFVEAGIGKREIYRLAAARGLDDIAALPAQPCLASRIETGIAVTREALAFIDEAERRLRPMVADGADLRCRVTADGVAVEVAPMPEGAARAAVQAAAAGLCAAAGRPFAGVRDYRKGSAFLRDARG